MTVAPSQRTLLSAILFLFCLTVFRLCFCTHLELVPDEAYYWEWSKHLDACYRDKGPAVAWTIAAGTWIAGDTEFGVRWLGVLLAAGTAWQAFVLARRLFDESVALAVLLISAIIPLCAVGAIIMTIDSLSVFFWAWSANLAWSAFQTNRKATWALLGFAIGCGFLAKFTNVLQLASVFLYLLVTPSKRRLIFSTGTILMTAVFAICTTSILYWNIINHWPNQRALTSRASLDVGFHLHPGQLLQFVGEQAVVISPLLYIGLVAGVAGMWIWRVKEDRIRFLLCDCLPIYACFTFFSLNVAGKANWTAPALICGVILMVVFWRDCLARSRAWWIPVGLALFLAFAETAALHDTSWLHLNPHKDPLQRARGWQDLADHTARWKEKYSTDLIIGNHYSQASILSFYLPGHPTTYTPTTSTIDNQYDLWPGYQVGPNTAALYVTDSSEPNAVNGNVQTEFKHITLLEKFYTQHNGNPVHQFQIYLCSNRDN
jgi:4-amino-4-deoxy-L-arabinose transferase-like glycosyltransferase